MVMPAGTLSPLVCTELGWKGRPCQFAPEPGDSRCAMHYGGSDTRKARNAKRYLKAALALEGELEKMKPGSSASMLAFGPPRDVDPGMALLEEVHRSAGHVAWLEEKVRGLEESELVWGTVMMVHEERSGGQGGDYTLTRKENRATINTWWDLYRKEREHLSKVSLAALKAGIEERRVRIAERGVDALELELSAALRDLGLDPADERVRSIVGKRLSEVVAADIFGQQRASAEHMVVQGELESRPPLVREAPQEVKLPPVRGGSGSSARDARADPTQW